MGDDRQNESDMARRKSLTITRGALTAFGLTAVLAAGLNPTQANADQGCRSVCITDLHRDGSNLHVGWAANEPFAYFEVYSEDQRTFDIRTEKIGADQLAFDIPDVQPGATYRVQVLGCAATTPWYNDGPCGNVDQRIITT